MSSGSVSRQGSQRRKRRRVGSPIVLSSKKYGRRPMASGLRSRKYVRQNIDDLASSRLTRRPLSSSSSSSNVDMDEVSSDGSVVDLTDDGTPGTSMAVGGRGSGSSTHIRNVLIIDSDEEVLEMEMPSPQPNRHRHPHHSQSIHPHNGHSTHHSDSKHSKKKQLHSKTTGESSSNVTCKDNQPEPRTPDSKQTGKAVDPPVKSSPGNEASKKIIQCPICMETVQQFEKDGRSLMVTRCGHMFCNVCIKKSVRAQRKCPSCRKPVTWNGFHPLFLS